MSPIIHQKPIFTSHTSLRPIYASPNTRNPTRIDARKNNTKKSNNNNNNTSNNKTNTKTKQQEHAVDLFNIESGWNVEALVDAEDLLDELSASSASSLYQTTDDNNSDDDDMNIDGWSVDSYVDDDRGVTSITFTLEDSDIGDNTAAYSLLDDDDDLGDDDDILSITDINTTTTTTTNNTNNNTSSYLGQAERDLLASIPDHLVRKLSTQQQEAEDERHRLKPSVQRKTAARQKTHRKLRIIGGYAAGKRILSPQGDQTRPMMDMVRGAVFSMISSLYGMPGILPEGSRWLDLFAGTGAIGIEALSRGAEEAHFVELSPWVVSNCLSPNLEHCEVDDQAIVHTTRAEDFLRNAVKNQRMTGGVFDFISVCPPYEAVSYTELYELLEESPLLHDQSVVIVEYPRKVAKEVRERIGPLVKLRDRKYGRTFIAVYGPMMDDDDYSDDYEDDGSDE